MDNLNIDYHKLNYHPGRVTRWFYAKGWQEAKKVYPIYVEISPSGDCNHRCTFCSLDFMGYQPDFLLANVLNDRVSEMAKLGVKSIMFAGEGEPLLHRGMADIAVHAKNAGVDIAFTTNATPLTGKFCQRALGSISWIKVSINAGSAETYAKIHRAPKDHFCMVLKNMENAVSIRNENLYDCTIGAQMVLLPENQKEAVMLARAIKNLGGDYLVLKPHSQHPLSKVKDYRNLAYYDDCDAFERMVVELKEIESEKFQVIFRRHTADKLMENSKPYHRCYSTPFFWAYITAAGNVYSCSMFLGDERFLLGNIYRNSFKEIWEGPERENNWELMERFDAENCRKNCRMDECNRYLHRQKNPPPHVNFI